MTPYDFDLFIKISLAATLGALIGYERQRYQKPAGVRTQMLICLGSALLAGLSIDIADMHSVAGALTRPDPTRLMAQIIAGIGFIGAGVILKGNDRISGVTTAATIWLTAAVGIAVGSGFYLVAAACVLLALLTHPVSKIKHRSTPKASAFIIKAPRADWLKTISIVESMPIEYQVVNLSSHTCEIRIFAAKATRQKLLQKLEAKDISFEFSGSAW